MPANQVAGTYEADKVRSGRAMPPRSSASSEDPPSPAFGTNSSPVSHPAASGAESTKRAAASSSEKMSFKAFPRETAQQAAFNTANGYGTDAFAAPDLHGRQEPTFRQSPLAGTGLEALYETKPSARRSTRIPMMLGIFLIGVCAGLSALWWLERGNLQAALHTGPAVRILGPALTAAAGPEYGSRRAPAISRGELPYDGNPPSVQKSAPVTDARPAMAINPDERPGGGTGMPTGSGAVEDRPREDATAASSGSSGADGEKQEASIQSPAISNDASMPVKPHARKAARLSQKHRSHAKSAKESEIGRIKQQAADELKRKNENSRTTGSSSQKSSRPETRLAGQNENLRAQAYRNNTSVVLARCERISNIFLREKCKWEICSGKWGRNGCPSYQASGGMQ